MSEEILKLATQYYRCGVLQNDKKSLLVACSKLLEINPPFFETNAKGYHLWGNILVSLGTNTGDESFFEQGIRKYDKALQISDDQEITKEINWDIAEGYILLGKKTKEISDFKKALQAYEKARLLGANLPHFWIDYGEALFLYGDFLNQSHFIKKGIFFFKKVVSDTAAIEDKTYPSSQSAYNRAWFLYAHGSLALLELQWTKEAFEVADAAFKQAILNVPHESALWLSWGKMCLDWGYFKKDLNLIDKGLEKLTAQKLQENDGFYHALLLAKGIIILGVFLDDLRLIKEGQKRVMQLDASPEVDFIQGFASYALGVHFNAVEHYTQAFEKFEKVKAIDPKNIMYRYMIYETTMALFDLTKEHEWLQKALKACTYICDNRPESTFFLTDLGICYYKWHQLEKSHSLCLELALESFKKVKEEDIRTLFHFALALDAQGVDLGDETLLEKAIATFEKVLIKLPSSLNIQLQLGLSYYHLGVLNKEAQTLKNAIVLFEAVIKHDKEDDVAFLNLGKAHLKLYELSGQEEERKKATLAFQEALKFGNRESLSFLQGGLLS